MNAVARFAKIAIAVSALVTALVFFAVQEETPDAQTAELPAQTSEIETDEDKMATARYLCMKVLEENLNDPDSAEWGIWSDNPYQTWPASIDGDIVTVTPEFRSKNGFGATVLSSFICRIDESDGWRLLELRELKT